MPLIQVVFGVVLQSDFMCLRCRAGGAEPGMLAINCRMCGGSGTLEAPRTYTYEASEPLPPLWSVVTEPGGKACTVVAHGSTYTGPVKSIQGPPTAVGHEPDDWLPVRTESGLIMQYRCRFCGVLIDSAVVLCAEPDAEALRAQLPGRLIFGMPGKPGWRELGDGREYAKITGLPRCNRKPLMVAS